MPDRYLATPWPHLFISLKDPIKTLYAKVLVLDAKKGEGEEDVVCDFSGYSTAYAPGTMPLASDEDFAGGVLETNGVEGWMYMGPILHDPVETDFVKMFGDPPDEANGEFFDMLL